MDVPHIETISMLDLRVMGDAKCAAAFISAPGGEMYDEPMIVLVVESANATESLEAPVKTTYVLEPEHAGEVAQMLARSALMGMLAREAQ